MCPSLAEPDSDGFPRSNFEMFPVKHFVATVPPEQLQDIRLLLRFHKAGRSCSPPRKAFAFLTTPSVCQKHGTRISLPAGSDQGYSPWTSPAFLKNCWIKKLFVSVLRTDDPTYFSSCKFPLPLAVILHCFTWNNVLGKTIACGSQNRFAVCLCAVRWWLCCPNWLWIFPRFRFFWISYASWMANSIYLLLLDCNHA